MLNLCDQTLSMIESMKATLVQTRLEEESLEPIQVDEEASLEDSTLDNEEDFHEEANKEAYCPQGTETNINDDFLVPSINVFPDQPQPYPKPDLFQDLPIQPSEGMVIQGPGADRVYPSMEDDQDLENFDDYFLKVGRSWVNHWDFLAKSNYDLSKDYNLSPGHLALDQNLKEHDHDTSSETFSWPLHRPEPFPSLHFPLGDFDFKTSTRDEDCLDISLPIYDSSPLPFLSLATHPFSILDLESSQDDLSNPLEPSHDSLSHFPFIGDSSISITVDSPFLPDQVLNPLYFSHFRIDQDSLTSKSVPSPSASHQEAKFLDFPDETLVLSNFDFSFHPTLPAGDSSSDYHWEGRVEGKVKI